MSTRALLVGIDAYDHFDPLLACRKDVAELEKRLAEHEDGLVNFEVEVLTPRIERVTRASLKRHARETINSGADVVLFYFAGHGAERAGDVILCT